MRGEFVFLVVCESDLDDWLGWDDQVLHPGQRAPSLLAEHDVLGMHLKGADLEIELELELGGIAN